MFQLMRSYIPHKDWRIRLAYNNAASFIWTFWVISMMGPAVLFVGIVFGRVTLKSALIMLAMSASSFAISYIFLPAAKKRHRQIVQRKLGVVQWDIEPLS